MFSTAIGRGVRALRPSAAASSAVSSCPVARAAKPLSVHYKTDQRRHSSSKTSRAPDGSRPVKAAPPSQEQGQNGEQGQNSEQAATGSRAGRRKSKPAASSTPRVDETFSKLPSVPSTQHIHHLDVTLSSFFSLHRPISITSALPSPTNSEAFDKIFDRCTDEEDAALKRESQSRQFKHTLEAFSHDHNSRLSNTADTMHFDVLLSQHEMLEQTLATQIPFSLPPVPEPGVLSTGPSCANRSALDPASNHDAAFLPSHSRPTCKFFRTTIKRKSWTTTIIVTETTDLHGRKSYKTTNSPITQIAVRSPPQPSSVVEEPACVEVDEIEGSEMQWRQPFLHRMWLRQQDSFRRRAMREPGQEREEMLLISVKRQRKLKMKKHKHKKLLRRTRHERRRLGKA